MTADQAAARSGQTEVIERRETSRWQRLYEWTMNHWYPWVFVPLGLLIVLSAVDDDGADVPWALALPSVIVTTAVAFWITRPRR
jgi:hypothetical protein